MGLRCFHPLVGPRSVVLNPMMAVVRSLTSTKETVAIQSSSCQGMELAEGQR